MNETRYGSSGISIEHKITISIFSSDNNSLHHYDTDDIERWAISDVDIIPEDKDRVIEEMARYILSKLAPTRYILDKSI